MDALSSVRLLKGLLLVRQIAGHHRRLGRECVVGRELNAAPWQKRDGILRFVVTNLSGDPGRVTVGDCCNLAVSIHCEARGQVHIGSHVFMSATTKIRCDHEIRVGNYCMFGPNVRLWDTNNHPLSVSHRERQAKQICRGKVDSYEAGGGPILIEDNVWLCMEVIVLAGVTIGYGSVVAAGSVVTKDVPAMSLAAGVPARVIGSVPE